MPVPVPPFTYVGPSTGAAFTAGVFNLAWGLATDEAAAALTRVDTAIALATNPQQITPGGVNQTFPLPTAPALPSFDPNDLDARFDAKLNEVVALLTTDFASFLTTYFPTSEYLTFAQAWIDDVFQVGGTGFAPGIEDAMWQRDRARLVTDSARASDEAMAVWANRGYPLPPGAANGTLLKLSQDLLDKTAQSSRDQVIKAAEIEIENLRFAVTNAIDLRMKSIDAAGTYIRTLALGPQIGAQMAAAVAQAEAALAGVTAQLYSATVAAQDIPARLRIADADLRARADEANLRASTEAQHDRVTAALGAASALGNIASAAVNGLHAQTGIAASESL